MRRQTLLLLLCCSCAYAEYPPVMEIVFEGNNTTQPKVMLREMVIREGDLADPEKIERSRQGIQDLGLFRSVTVEQTPVRGGVKLTYTVREKYYILPYPRLSANLEGQSSYGAEVRWNNILGLNHSLRVVASQSNLRRTGRGKQTNYAISYNAPFLFDSPYNVNLTTGRVISPVTGDVSYDETFNNASLTVSRTYSGGGPASQGWTLGSGVLWQSESREGPGVPPPYGKATALLGRADYRDVRFKVYSEEGVAYGLAVAGAKKGFASDYNYSTLTGNYTRLFAVGETAHQNLNFSFDAGARFDGPREVNVFTAGGSGSLRGYKRNFIEGNAFYLLGAEYVRPIGWPWLRAAVILEAGNVFDRPQDISADKVYTSLGVSLRVRLPLFVNFELEAGYALPLNGGPGKIFGGRV